MNAVTVLLAYAVALSWFAPALLTASASAGAHPRLAVAGWIAAVGSALSAWAGAVVILVVGAVHAVVTRSALTFCVETLGLTSAVHLPSSTATALVVVLLIATSAVALYTVRRVVMALIRGRRRNVEHAEAVSIVGRPTEHPGVVEISARQPTAYCVSGGGRSVIVMTTAVRDLLDEDGMAAVLAHERAHLRGRHHHVIAVLNALAAALPRLPLMRRAAREVAALLEMCADDAASREHGRTHLLTSLALLSTGDRLPEGALAAAGTAVLDRLLRLAQPPATSWWRPHVAVFAVMAACGVPIAALSLCVY
jgi:Zn-dependent protease with chaperone function